MNKKRFLLIPLFSAMLFLPVLAMAASFTYTPMEQIPGFATDGNFYSYIGAVYKFGIWTVGIAAMLMITIGGYMYIVSAGNQASMGKAKSIIFDAIIGLILALTSYLILYEINPNLVSLSGGAVGGPVPAQPGAPPVQPAVTPSGTCTNAAADMKNICTAGCQKTCDVSRYDAIIARNATSTVTAGMIKSIICHEDTTLNPNIVSSKGACGLMQVMPSGSCTSDSRWGNLFDPETNIRAGVATFAAKLSRVSGYNYTGVTKLQMAAASYNCCGDGTSPNTPSRDCSADNVPKWACPINPGDDPKTNMCTVKNYACDVAACSI